MMQSIPSDKETQLLLQAFHAFSAVSSSLEKTYLDLQEEVGRLSWQLEESNYYLHSLLHSLPCGVMVVDPHKKVTTINQAARQLLSLADLSLPCTLEEMISRSPYKEKLAKLAELVLRQEAAEVALSDDRILNFSWSEMKNGERILVMQEVTEMRRLQRQMQQAERLSAMGEMAVEVAHEIRNPLAGLQLFVTLLREEDLSKADHDRYLENIQIVIRSLNTIVTNMLCFSRNPEPTKEPVFLSEPAKEIVSFMAPLMKQRGIQLETGYQDRQAIQADREMIRQMLTNLILNALHALPQGGKVQVKTRQLKTAVQIMISDNGIGIPKERQPLIFDPHFTTNPKGNGLGLAVVHRMVEAHGGKIRVKSKEGVGTQFTISFPTGGQDE